MCNNKNKHSGGVLCSACNAFIHFDNTACIMYIVLFTKYRGSYISALVLLNLLNELGEKIRCEAVLSIIGFPQRVW